MGDRIVVEDLVVKAADHVLVNGVSLNWNAGEVIGLVGASGSGKTMTARSLLGLTPVRPGVVSGSVTFEIDDQVLSPYDGHPMGRQLHRAFSSIRGKLLGYVAQDARAALDPLQRVGHQVATSARMGGHGIDPNPWLIRAGFADPTTIVRQFPHHLSGGMAQRVTIAQALARGSRFLIADEPTTGLDPVISASLIQELAEMAASGIGVLVITHDLRLLPDIADTIYVMDSGKIVERGQPEALLSGSFSTHAGTRLVQASRKIAGGRLG